jgi:2-polyprenyl-3-methyl-5-hydroxy-6-metoxy-1,4-benzoquinol methylase
MVKGCFALHTHDGCMLGRAADLMRIRYKPWPKVVEFLESLDEGAWVADVGCGNGKLSK